MILWSPLRQKLQSFWCNSFQKRLPHLTSIVVLVAVLLVYSYSIFHDRLPLEGHPDIAARFMGAMKYARDPSRALSLKLGNFGGWLGIWPPVPFIIQGFVLRLVLFPGMSDTSAGIMVVQLTSVFLVLLGFYFIGRSVALQTDEPTGLLAFLMCFSATIMLYLAHTTLSEVYAFFFVSLAIWNLFRFINKNKGLSWSVLSFALAFFCRSESLVIALVAGVFLLAHRQWRPAALIVGTVTVLAVSKLLGAILLIEGTKFFEHYVGIGQDWQSKLRNALRLPYYLLRHNKELILLSGICALPLIYYAAKPVKRRKFPAAGKVGNDRDGIKGHLSVTVRKAGFVARLARTYDLLCSWLVRVPIVFWAVSFLAIMGVLILAMLKGQSPVQWRYLYMANVFMTTAIALLAAQAACTLYARGEKFAKRSAIGIVTVLVAFSLWSGFSHATGRKVGWNILPSSESEKDVVQFIREHRVQGDRVAFDFLLESREVFLASHLLDPSLETPTQFRSEQYDREIASFLPEQREDKLPIVRLHAFIHIKRPRFLVLASDQRYKSIVDWKAAKKWRAKIPINPIRGYLTPVEGTESEFVFKSPYVLPEIEIPFTKVHENDFFIILERGSSQENSQQ